jgi:uncharacterized CHY-type Zn-finger protein
MTDGADREREEAPTAGTAATGEPGAAPAPAEGDGIRGVEVDPRGRCAHYRSPEDVVAVRFPCCGAFWACHACHAGLADHEAERWPASDFRRKAVRCGACGAELTIDAYLDSPSECPRCGAAFNPRCERHHHLYFEARPRPDGG